MSVKRLLDREGDRRGVSNVLGMVLVVGMIVIATMVIVVVGATAFENSQSTVSMESAVTAMEDLNDKILEVAADSKQRASVSIPSMEEANLRVENSGWINVSIVNESSKNARIWENKSLGRIVYERNEQTVAVQGGGVWRTNRGGNSVAMIDEPSFQYRYGNGYPTVTLSIINLTGTSISGNDVIIDQQTPRRDILNTADMIGTNEQLNITVKSEYYLGWRAFFNETTDGKVKIVGPKTVRLVLFGPDTEATGGRAPGAILAPYSGGHATNGNLIDSYDSRVGRYSNPSQIHNNGDVSLNGTGNIQMSRNVLINGSLNAKAGFAPKNNVEITGEVRISEGGRVVNNVDIGGYAAFGGELRWSAGEVEESVFVNGEGNMISQGDFLYTAGNIRGAIHVNGSVVVKNGVSYSGEKIVASGDIEISGGSVINANISSGGDVIVNDGDITGTIRAEGNVTLDAGSINGNVYDADGRVTGSAASNHHGNNLTISPSFDADPKWNESLEPVVEAPDPHPATETIREKSGIGTSVSCGSGCTLNAGDYHQAGDIRLRGSSEQITFNTTGGNIELYVDGSFAVAGGSKVNVTGDGHVSIYVGGPSRNIRISGDGTRVGPRDHDATQLTIWARHDAQLLGMSGHPKFIGVIYGPGNSTVQGMKMTLTNSMEIYGSVIGYPQAMSADLNIHYDTALSAAGSRMRLVATGPKDVLYLSVSHIGLEAR